MVTRGTGVAVDPAPRPLPPEPAAVASGRADWVRLAVVVVLVASVALRFLARGPLWLDEAQTVQIANRSLPHLFHALREDGSPPLYYVVLHAWMSVVGTGTFAVRALSGVFAVATLPVMWLVARRFGLSRGAAWAATLLLTTSPFAVRYASEARMYALELLLVLLALLAYHRVWSTGGRAAQVGAALTTGALVLTQYWALFLVALSGAALIVVAVRGEQRAAARRTLGPLVIGSLAFAPWLPSFAYQSAHTGAPWAPPPGLGVSVGFVQGWAGAGAGTIPLILAYYLLIAIAVAGYPGGRGAGVTFRRPFRRQPLLLLALAVGTMTIGVLASKVSTSAYAPRYSVIAFAPVLLVVAAGIFVLDRRARVIALGIVCGLSLLASALIPTHLRTQAGQVSALLASATPQDLVVFCPDQLGPAVHRLAPNAGRQVVYPTFGSAAIVDWVDYAKRNRGADPIAFAREALQRSAGHPVWFVYENGYATLAGGCSSVFNSLTAARGVPVIELTPHGAAEKYAVARFPG